MIRNEKTGGRFIALFALKTDRIIKPRIQSIAERKHYAMAAHINDEMLNKMDAYWRAANYLAAGQLYLLDNPLLKEPLKPEHIKKKIVGHWGTVPGQDRKSVV